MLDNARSMRIIITDDGKNETERLAAKVLQKSWWVLREGANHIIMTNGTDIEPVPRHKEINEALAKAIIRRRDL